MRRGDFVFILMALVFFSGSAWSLISYEECREVSPESEVKECKLLVHSKALGGHDVYVKAWVPREVLPETPVLIFFHGRGYAHPLESSTPTMLEAAGIEEWLMDDSSPAMIILSPQDLFQREGRIGNDYWIGADGRDWETFVTQELRGSVTTRWELSEKPWLAAGISMGAHGAMKFAMDYPQWFAAFAAISPVFRSTENEIDDFDGKVFFSQGDISQTSVGARLLKDQRAWKVLEEMPHWIDIHGDDFALGKDFRDSAVIWQRLTTRQDSEIHHVEVVIEPIQAPGHSMTYWRMRLPLVLDWLSERAG